MAECRTCELLERRDRGDAPDWDAIVRTEGWDVVHCDATSVYGWMVLVVRRHVAAVAELTDGEAAELGPLVAQLVPGAARDLRLRDVPESERVSEDDMNVFAAALRRWLDAAGAASGG